MAIAVDSNTVAPNVPASGTTQTSSAFSPPGGSLLLMSFNSHFASTVSSITDSLGALTNIRKLIGFVENSDCDQEFWVADVPATAPGSMTVTYTMSASTQGQVAVLILTGAATAVNQTGATPLTGNSFGATTLVCPNSGSMVTTQANSWVFGSYGTRSGSTTAPTMAAGQTDMFNGITFVSTYAGNVGFVCATSTPSGAAGTSVQLAPTYPSSIEYGAVMVEVLAATGGGAASIPNLTMAPMVAS